MIQYEIEKIINSDKNNKDKINLLGFFFEKLNIKFIDMDDTLTSENNILFGKYHYYKLRRGDNEKTIFNNIKNTISLNKNIIKNNFQGDFIIITRNNYFIAKSIIETINKLLKEKQLKIIGAIGNIYYGNTDFFILSKDKKTIISDHLFISDKFEYSEHKNNKNFISINKNNGYLNIIFSYIFKLILFTKFVIIDITKQIKRLFYGLYNIEMLEGGQF